VTVAAKSRQFTADKTGKGQFLQGNQKNLAEEGVVRKSSPPQRVASVSNLCNSRSQGQGTWVMGSVAPVLASESARSFPGSPAWPGTHWKLRAIREESESERSQISQKDFGWRNLLPRTWKQVLGRKVCNHLRVARHLDTQPGKRCLASGNRVPRKVFPSISVHGEKPPASLGRNQQATMGWVVVLHLKIVICCCCEIIYKIGIMLFVL